jgi:hyaluronate lyase
VNSSSTNCTDPTASNGINYFYAVSAAAACGGESAKSPDSNPVTPSAGAYIITSPSSVTTGYNYTPSFNVTVVNAISNQWFLSTNNGASWDRVTTGTGGTNASYTTDFTTTNMNGNKYECVSYGCSGAVTSAPATLTINMVDQFDTLRLSWQTNLFNTGSSLSSIASKANGYWSTMDTNVSRTFLWSDLPFGSDSGNIVSSFNRLQSMALAWSIPGSSLQSNALLSAAVTGGLDWMNANVYTANTNQPQYSGSLNNWYDWEISGPLSLNNTVVLMYPALTGLQVSNYCRAIDNFGPDGNTAQPYFNWANLTGANTSDVVLNMILRGILGKSAGKTTEAQTNLSSVFPYVTSGDGFYTDGSFVFHGNIAYNGHYGFVLLGDIATLVNYLQGSTWQITDPSLSNVYSWIFNSFEPLLYNGAMMDMVRGRALSWSSSTETTDGSMVISDIQQIAKFAPTATATSLTAFANSPLLSPGQFHFYNMDRIVALRSGFGFGISMSSSRIANYENLFATSNLKAWFTGDGMTYLYLGNPDTQFTGDCWPTMDWYHLPGTTSETNATPQPGTTDQDWVGGAQLSGTYGVAGMAQHANNTTLYSRKSWFMFDNEVVCLGAGITCSDNNRIDTTVENRRLGASPTNNFWVNGTKIIPTVGWSSNLNSASWCSLDGVGGYYFPGGATNLQAAFLTNSGSWSQIKVGDSPTVYTDEFLQLYFKHGVKPTNATYAYVLLPNMTASDMSNYAFSPDIVVITNTPTIQAASKPLLGLVAANFWTGGNNSIGMITVNKQASVILQTNSTSFSVGISDPTQTNQGSITLTLNLAAYSVLSADPGVTVLQLRPQLVLSINVSTKPGATFQASFVTATNLINTMPPAIVSAGMVGLPSQFRIKFTGDTNYTQTVLGSTNLEIPITNWTVLGTAAQISNGLYQFTDGNVTNNSQRFYRIRSP